MNSTSIYVQWSHSIPQKLANGILIGYRLAWYEDHYSVGHPLYSGGYADVGLDTSDYTVSSLHEFWLYHISVAGRTSVGHGIYTTVSLMTDDNGKSFTKCYSTVDILMHPVANCKRFLRLSLADLWNFFFV